MAGWGCVNLAKLLVLKRGGGGSRKKMPIISPAKARLPEGVVLSPPAVGGAPALGLCRDGYP